MCDDDDEGELAGGRFLTAVLGLLSAREGGSFELRLASAGHPAPILLRPTGAASRSTTEGGVIGVALPGGWEERTRRARARRRARALHRRRQRSRALEPLEADELAALMPPLAARDAEAIAESVLDIARTRGEGRLRDDVAVIAVRVPPALIAAACRWRSRPPCVAVFHFAG